MKHNRAVFVVLGFIAVSFACIAATQTSSVKKLLTSAVVSAQRAQTEQAPWGTFATYFAGESFGTRDALTGVAVIKPGQEIHPPHQHAEEEYLMIIAGEGTWHLNGKNFPAHAEDILYAAPWEVHGIKNTGSTPLKFVVWKWNNKGVAAPAAPNNTKD